MALDKLKLRGISRWGRSQLVGYIYAVVLVALVTLLVGFPLHYFLHPTNLIMFYLAAVVAAAVFLGRGPAMLASLLGMLAFDFFFVEPRLTFTVYDTQYILTFIGFLLVGVIISNLTVRLKDQVEIIQRREAQTAALYSLSRDLTTASGLEQVLEIVLAHIRPTFTGGVFILLPQNNAGLEVRANLTGEALSTEARELAQNVYNRQVYLSLEPGQPLYCIPLETTSGILGALVLQPSGESGQHRSELRQMEAFCNLAALAVERAHLEEQANQAEVLKATERLQSALLNSISHDLRTPLSTISGVLDSLEEAESGRGQVTLEQPARLDLLQTAREEAHRLNRLVGNLLDMTRLEAGALRLNLEEADAQDLIGASLARTSERLAGHPVHTSVPEDLPPVVVDFVLIEQVLVNLLDNAARYSPPGSPVDVSAARESPASVQITVMDRGLGIPIEELDKVFNKFYRLRHPEGSGGIGLGLSICKGIVEAHGGTIHAEQRAGGGSIFAVCLPCQAAPGDAALEVPHA